MRKLCLSLAMVVFLSLTSLVYAGEEEWTLLGPPGGRGVVSLATDTTTNIIYTVSGVYEAYKSTDGGQTWTDISERFPPASYHLLVSIAMDPGDPDIVYIGGHNGNQGVVYKTTDAGSTWVYAGSGFPTGPGSDVWVIAIDPLHPDTLYAGTLGWGVYKSTNGGEDWVLKPNGLFNPYVVSIVIDPQNSQTLYAASCGAEPFLGNAFKSIDGGESWTEVDSGFFPPWWPETPPGDTVRGDISSLAINPLNPNILYIGVKLSVEEDPPFIKSWCTVYKSTNGATSWARADSGLPPVDGPITLAVDPMRPDTVYAGFLPGRWSGKTVYRSTNGGQSWEEFSNGLSDHIDINQLLVAPTNPPKVFAATSSNLWGYTYKNGIEENPSPYLLPRQLSLSQNYPNPFNSNTAISYQLSGVRPHHTTLTIYNILGQEVNILVDRKQTPGYYSVIWDGKDNFGKEISSGVYFYRLEVKGDGLKLTKSRKMILLR